MRALGYPGRGTLTAWVREAFPEARTPMVGRSWHPGYREEVRQVGVFGLCNGDETAQQVADRLGVSRPTLYSWKDQLLGHKAPSSMKRRKANSKAPDADMFSLSVFRHVSLSCFPEIGMADPTRSSGTVQSWRSTSLSRMPQPMVKRHDLYLGISATLRDREACVQRGRGEWRRQSV